MACNTLGQPSLTMAARGFGPAPVVKYKCLVSFPNMPLTVHVGRSGGTWEPGMYLRSSRSASRNVARGTRSGGRWEPRMYLRSSRSASRNVARGKVGGQVGAGHVLAQQPIRLAKCGQIG